MMDPLQIAQTIVQRKIQNHPEIQQRIQNVPWAQAGIQAILTGNAQAGVEIANNICQSYNATPEQLIDSFNRGNINLNL